MAGSLSPKTMRVEGIIILQNVLILINIGSTHNFMDPYVARKSRLPMGESQLIVKVANNDNLVKVFVGQCLFNYNTYGLRLIFIC